jgi:hypothetical protein
MTNMTHNNEITNPISGKIIKNSNFNTINEVLKNYFS